MRNSERLDVLKRLLRENNISSQAELLDAMRELGYQMTQSTLSRDLSAIKAVKIKKPDNKSLYTLPVETRYIRTATRKPAEDEVAHWYVMYTRRFHEKKVAELLTSLGIEAWIPIQLVRRRWSDRMKTMEKLVIPKTVFIHCSEKRRHADTFVPATMGYMTDYTTHSAAIIPDAQIEVFKKMVSQTDVPIEFTEEQLMPGIEVDIVSGPFVGLSAELFKVENVNKIFVRIGCLGCATVELSLNVLRPKAE